MEREIGIFVWANQYHILFFVEWVKKELLLALCQFRRKGGNFGIPVRCRNILERWRLFKISQVLEIFIHKVCHRILCSRGRNLWIIPYLSALVHQDSHWSSPETNHTRKTGSVSISPGTIVGLSLLFFVICVVGICGNSFVVCAVICNKKMRTSMTNLLITNLAFADLLIMVFGIPETILFMLDQGWLFNRTACKVNRYVMVTSLYGSVLTLIALCVERWGNALIWSQSRHEI